MSDTQSPFASLGNGRSLDLGSIPSSGFKAFSHAIVQGVSEGKRVSSLFAAPAKTGKPGENFELYAVLADDEANGLLVARTEVDASGFPSMTPECPQVHLFEREMAEEFGLRPQGHPWLKPVRYPRSGSPNSDPLPGTGDFFQVQGEEIHEVAVGPVHAGVIEPGHFRFQCHGERVLHLEIALGYQHRGVEKALAEGPNSRSLHLAETLAGDTTIGHATSYCQVVEALSSYTKTVHAQTVRGIALELERVANHVGDLGAISGDVGYLPTASFCGRIRGDFLNMTALLCGSRFGRGLLRPGGLGYDLEPERAEDLARRVAKGEKEIAEAVGLLWDEQSVMARLEDTGPLSAEEARDLGVVGPAARASGLVRDVRYTQPSGIFRFSHIPVATWDSGDVFARAYVRWLEIQRSLTFVKDQLRSLAPAQESSGQGKLGPERLAVSLNEGWRGEICHVAITDDQGRFRRYKVVDPSFHNWFALAQALRDEEISDFPLCNKSFNLSYCGHDL